MKIDEGIIQDGEYEGLALIAILQAMSDSSWDFPSAIFSLGLDEHFGPDEPTMYPAEHEAKILSEIAYPDIPESEITIGHDMWDADLDSEGNWVNGRTVTTTLKGARAFTEKHRKQFQIRFLRIGWDT